MSQARLISPTFEKSQLSFNQISELLTQGLMPYLVCFCEDTKAASLFSRRYAASLTPSILLSTNFNTFGTLLVKANHQQIPELTLTPMDHAHLGKLGYLTAANQQTLQLQPAVIENYVHDFFRKSSVMSLATTMVKTKYRPQMLQLIENIYGIVEVATCSIALEQVLTHYDGNNQRITNKEKQDPKFSTLDLQLGCCTLGLKQILDSIMGKKKKSRHFQAIFAAAQKMNAMAATATGEYTKNLSAHKEALLRNENVKLKLLNMPRLLGEQKDSTATADVHNRSDDPDSAEVKSASTPSSTPPDNSPEQLTPTPDKDSPSDSTRRSSSRRTPPTPEQIEKQNEETRRLLATEEKISSEAMTANTDEAALTATLSHLLHRATSDGCTAKSLLEDILLWEKAALAYLERKIIPATPKSFLVRWNLLAPPPTNPLRAIVQELKDILRQCIILAEFNGHLKEAVGLLNQHLFNISHNHAPSQLANEIVYSQLETATIIITEVARQRFDYPPKQTMPSPTQATQ